MKLLQSTFTPGVGWSESVGSLNPAEASLVMAFGQRSQLANSATFTSVKEKFPTARLIFVSTAGSFFETLVEDESVACTALSFESASLRTTVEKLDSPDELSSVCKRLIDSLVAPDLKHVLILSDGSVVNGTTLTDTFNKELPAGVTVSGGLAGDGTDFKQTIVGLDAPPSPSMIVAVGFYGASLRIGFGSSGGWVPFGPKRKVTASHGNILQRLDDRLALELYKNYLGPEADSLPASALRFPLHVTAPGDSRPVVRTILSIDEKEGTMTFAGDIPLNSTVQLMKASYEDLITGAQEAAESASRDTEMVFCVSCVGRRIVLGQRVDEEIEGVRNVFPKQTVMAGFYSYGEIAPSGVSMKCQLHNQTMTITTLSEVIP